MNKVNLVCVVDDDKIYRYTVEKYIKMLNLAQDVRMFSDGEEAINYISKEANQEVNLPDVIFLDVNMPMLDGWEFIEEFKKIRTSLAKEIKIYMVSSSIDERDRKRAASIPEISDFIVKPIEETKLRALLQS